MTTLDEQTERRAHEVIGAAIEVHRELGPGYVESVYEKALCIELTTRGVPFVTQKIVRVYFKGHEVGLGRVDLIVDDCLIVENKAVAAFTPVDEGQLLGYLKATGLRLGLLINYKVPVLKDGLRRMIH
jgi:GxxExxY protein